MRRMRVPAYSFLLPGNLGGLGSGKLNRLSSLGAARGGSTGLRAHVSGGVASAEGSGSEDEDDDEGDDGYFPPEWGGGRGSPSSMRGRPVSVDLLHLTR